MRVGWSLTVVAVALLAGDGGCSSKTCTTNTDCGSGQQCLFVVGSCSAAGQCLSLGSECGLVVSYCACDGTTIGGLCGPSYAYAPTQGTPSPCGPPPTSPSGGTLTTLALVTGALPEYLAVDPANVYVAALGVDAVLKVPIGGGPVVTLASGQDQPTCIVTDGTNVYWTNQGSGTGAGTVMKVPLDHTLVSRDGRWS